MTSAVLFPRVSGKNQHRMAAKKDKLPIKANGKIELMRVIWTTKGELAAPIRLETETIPIPLFLKIKTDSSCWDTEITVAFHHWGLGSIPDLRLVEFVFALFREVSLLLRFCPLRKNRSLIWSPNRAWPINFLDIYSHHHLYYCVWENAYYLRRLSVPRALIAGSRLFPKSLNNNDMNQVFWARKKKNRSKPLS